MRITSLTSSANGLLKKIRSLHERNARQKTGLFLLEGEKLLLEAVQRGVEMDAVVLETDYFQKGISQVLEAVLADELLFEDGINLAPPSLFKDLVTTTTSCGLVAAAKCRTTPLENVLSGMSKHSGEKNDQVEKHASPEKPGLETVIFLESIQDPGNLGSIMRTALAFGASGLILGRGTVDPYNPKVVRSAMGALFDLPVVVDANLVSTISDLKKAGFLICALNPEAEKSLTEMDLALTKSKQAKVVFLLGNEGAGLSQEASELADLDLRIDMSDKIESLNVSIAAAIVLFHCYNVAKGN